MNPTVGSGARVCVWTFSKEVKLVRCHHLTHYCYFLEFSFGVIILVYLFIYFMYVLMIASKLLGMKLFGIELVLMMQILLIWDFELCIALHEHFSIPVFRFGFTLHSRETLPIVMLSVQRRGHHYGLI